MQVQRLNPPSLMKPIGSYCQVARKGNIVTVAGMVAIDASGNLVGAGDIRAQTRKVLENMQTALVAAGAKVTDVLKTTVYLSDFSNYKGMNEIFDEVFKSCPPARATIRADLYKPEWLIEIDAIAVADS